MRHRSTSLALIATAGLAATLSPGCGNPDRDRDLGNVPQHEEGVAPEGQDSSYDAEPLADPYTVPDADGASIFLEASTSEAAPLLDHRSSVRLVAARAGSELVLIPSTVVVASGPDRELQIENRSGEDRRLVIDELGVSESLPAGEERTVRLPRLDPNAIYSIRLTRGTPTATTTVPPPGDARAAAGTDAVPQTRGAAEPIRGTSTPAPADAMQHGALVVLGAPGKVPLSS